MKKFEEKFSNFKHKNSIEFDEVAIRLERAIENTKFRTLLIEDENKKLWDNIKICEKTIDNQILTLVSNIEKYRENLCNHDETIKG
jgi:hypothetical protein